MKGDCIVNSDRGLAASRNFIAGSLVITTSLVVTGSLTSLTIASSLAIVNNLAIGSDGRSPGSDHYSNRGGGGGRNGGRRLLCSALDIGRDGYRAHIRSGSHCDLRLRLAFSGGCNCDNLFFRSRSHRNGLLFRCSLGLEQSVLFLLSKQLGLGLPGKLVESG